MPRRALSRRELQRAIRDLTNQIADAHAIATTDEDHLNVIALSATLAMLVRDLLDRDDDAGGAPIRRV